MAYDIYLKLPNVKGESKVKGHEGESQILSFSVGAFNKATTVAGTGGSGAGKADLADFSITKVYDSASPVLFQNCCTGTHYDNVTISCQKVGGKEALKHLVITMKNAFVTGISWSGGGGDEQVQEIVQFSYGEIGVDYQPQDVTGAAAGGKIHGGWNQVTLAVT